MKNLRSLLLLLPASVAFAQTITTTSLPNGNVNQTYSAQLTCTNCAPAVWAIASGSLPPVLSLNSQSGAITGVPSTAGLYNFIVSLTLPGNGPVTKALSITIVAPLSNLTQPFPNGNVNVAYPSHKLAASGGQPPYVWSIATGSLPPGLGISGVTIGGTPTTAGTFPFTLRVTDSAQNYSDATFIITIAGVLTILNSPFPNGTLNLVYPAQQLSASGGTAPYTWFITSGALPPGLNIVGSTIAGTPTAVGTYQFTLSVYDSLQNTASVVSSITIAGAGGGLVINTTSLPNGVTGVPYIGQLVCSNCKGATWAISSGTLPPVLMLNSQSGAITGTPTTVGPYNFTVALSLVATQATVVTQNLSIAVVAPVSINESTIPATTVNATYSAPLTGAGGTPPYTWAFTGTANDGLTINPNSGTISGLATTAGQFTLGVQITDSTGAQASKLFTLYVAATLGIATTALPNGTVGTVYPTQTLAVNGGQAPFRWTLSSGTLPPGLTLDGVFGRISGTPTANGAYPFVLAVTDNLANSAKTALSITVGGAITITPSTLPAAAVGTAYSQTLTAAGGQAPYTWSLAIGALPAGITLNAATGVVSGTPTVPGTATFTAQATDASGAIGQARYILSVTGPVTITTTSLPDATVGAAYSQTVAASGGMTPYSWSITAGALPAGLTLNPASGVISGTPTAAAASSFTVTVTDAGQVTAKQALSIATAVALTVTPATLPNAVVGTAYTQKFAAAGGKAPYTFAVTGTLPAGFTFTPGTATIAGTAAAAETGSFTLTVTDASARTVTLPLTLTAALAPLNVTPNTLTAIVGVPFNQKLTVTGGVAPYTFAQGLGVLPSGFTFNAGTGTVSGTAPAAESGFVNIVVTDASGTTATFVLNLTANNPPAPTITVTGLPAASGFSQQLPAAIAIATPYPLPITGAISLTFAPSVTPAAGVDDAMIQFSSGTRVITFTIPAGSTTPALTNASSVTVLTGTTAGTITITTSLTVNGQGLGTTTNKIVNTAGVPFISSVAFQQTPGGVTVTVVGFSSTRDMVSGLFHFAPASNVTFTQADVTVPLAAAFTTWWTNTAQSNPFGTQFTLTVPFTLNTQSTSVVSVTVTLTNSKGASNPVTLAQ